VSQAHIPIALRRQVEEDARQRCGYCLCQVNLVGMEMLIDHVKPGSRGGKTVRGNLWLACNKCNELKSDHTHAEDPLTGRRVRLFNPRRQIWSEHFRWIEGGLTIEGLRPTG
jgi:5-methylcytosine-specific restriction endonuclease McrA